MLIIVNFLLSSHYAGVYWYEIRYFCHVSDFVKTSRIEYLSFLT